MIRFSRLCSILFLGGLLCVPSGLRADIAPLQVSGGTAALKSTHQTIRMDSEEVTIRLERGSYAVEAVFYFSNSGDTTTEWVGFPKGDQSFESVPGHIPDFVQFHAWVDGEKVPFAAEGKRWLARQVTFPGNAKTVIRIVYEADYVRGQYATYIVGTGSYWKDSIGRACFTIDGSAIGGTKHFTADLKAPQSHRLLTEKAVRIEVTDYEPDLKAILRVQLSGLTRGGAHMKANTVRK